MNLPFMRTSAEHLAIAGPSAGEGSGDLQNYFADVFASFQIAMSGGGFGEGEDTIDENFDAAGFEVGPDLGVEFARDGTFFRDGAGTHGGAGEGDALLHDFGEVDGGGGS